MLELRLLGTMGRNSLSCSRRRSAGNVVFEEKYTMEEISKLANVKSGFGVNLDIQEGRESMNVEVFGIYIKLRQGLRGLGCMRQIFKIPLQVYTIYAGGSTFRNTLSHYPQVRLGVYRTVHLRSVSFSEGRGWFACGD